MFQGSRAVGLAAVGKLARAVAVVLAGTVFVAEAGIVVFLVIRFPPLAVALVSGHRRHVRAQGAGVGSPGLGYFVPAPEYGGLPVRNGNNRF